MSKTVGIVTCHTPMNYGAMLQAYGLQKYILSQGWKPEIIDYFPDIYKEEISLLYVGDKRFRRNIILRIGYLISKLPSRLRRHKFFSSFKNKHLNISSHRYKSFEELKENPPKYNTYICGSDQIWNTKGFRGWNPTFYLQFVKDKLLRNSYAASMSLELPMTEKVKTEVLPMISEINNVSVRELCIQEELEKLVDKPIHHVMDPVYLLSDEDWSKLYEEVPSEKEDYILIYPMGGSMRVVENARKLSKKTGLPIYCISASKRRIPGVTKHFDCSIPKFVRLLKDAKYVITNSFHGTSFSIIFRKNFWSCEVGYNNHRITEILDLLKLQSRYLPDSSDIDVNALQVNYEDSMPILNTKISESKNFLSNVLNQK